MLSHIDVHTALTTVLAPTTSAQSALFVLAVKSVVLLGAAAIVVACMQRRSAAARHLVWSIALTSSLALPVLSLVLPAWPLSFLRELPPSTAPTAAIASIPAPAVPAEEASHARRAARAARWTAVSRATTTASATAVSVATRTTTATENTTAVVVGSVATSEPVAAMVPVMATNSAGVLAAPVAGVPGAQNGTFAGRDIMPLVLTVVWPAGVLLLLARLAFDVLAVSRLVHRAWPVESDPVLRFALGEALLRCTARDAELRVSDDIDVPVTWGIGSPVVLLPREATEWSAERRRLVLEHELAHVMRRDVCMHFVASVARALYWINPLAWLAERELRSESEQACDDAVLARGVRPTRYAEELLNIARTIGPAGVPALAPGLVRRPRIERRLRALLDVRLPRRLVTRRDTAMSALAVVVLALPLAAMRPAGAGLDAAIPADEASVSSGTVMVAAQADTLIVMPAMPAVPATPAMATAPGAVAIPATEPGAALVMVPAAAAASLETSAPQICAADGGSSSNMTNDHDNVRTWEVHWTGRDCGVDLRAQGKLAFSDDLSDVTSISPGGWFDLTVRDGDHLTRLYIKADGNGALDHRWTTDGTVRPWDASGRQWLGEFLLALDRRTAFAADTRFPQLIARGGVNAVLDEIGNMQGDYARGVYFQKLLTGEALDPGQVRRVLTLAGAAIRSDYTMGQVLVTVANRYGLPDAATREAFLRAVDTIQSDYERSRTLNALLDRAEPSTEEVATVLQSASKLGSDYELARTLVALVQHKLVVPSLFGKFLDDATQIKSDYERSRVLRSLLGIGHLSDEDVARVIGAASGIQSDYEKANVLVAVASAYNLKGDARGKYEQAANGIRSNYDRARALAALGSVKTF